MAWKIAIQWLNGKWKLFERKPSPPPFLWRKVIDSSCHTDWEVGRTYTHMKRGDEFEHLKVRLYNTLWLWKLWGPSKKNGENQKLLLLLEILNFRLRILTLYKIGPIHMKMGLDLSTSRWGVQKTYDYKKSFGLPPGKKQRMHWEKLLKSFVHEKFSSVGQRRSLTTLSTAVMTPSTWFTAFPTLHLLYFAVQSCSNWKFCATTPKSATRKVHIWHFPPFVRHISTGVQSLPYLEDSIFQDGVHISCCFSRRKEKKCNFAMQFRRILHFNLIIKM